ncbi:ABC transporter ATP-binding protein [Aureivirga sp. CE67]|uniref:ABC transporter ATP-binding protein n=1 Tax=Aureivirga sp. CE67 TaxID=1788983 RepID=UPI0018C8E943|nr:ATP-binding cassette domain-containing protein [Aureivirga sp. CE67]
METILKINNLTKNFGNVRALDKVSFTIEKGNVYGILGPNGSGKSTTLGIILNVVNKTYGDFQWFDGNLSTHEALKKVGAIIERPNFYPYMTAKQNLELVCKIKGVPTSAIDSKLEAVNLYEWKNYKFAQFSLGMKQRLAIASALLNDPEILILDEPTNGLDPQGIHEIRSIIKKIAENGTTILLASHLLDEVEKVCTHAVIIRKGQMLYSGRVDQMTATYGIIEASAEEISLEELAVALEQSSYVESANVDFDKVVAKLNANVSATEINKFLISKNIVVSYFEKKMPSLEQQFLELTNNN